MAEASEQLKQAMNNQDTIKTEKLKEILLALNFSFTKGAADESKYLKQEIVKLRTENNQLKKTIIKYQKRITRWEKEDEKERKKAHV